MTSRGVRAFQLGTAALAILGLAAVAAAISARQGRIYIRHQENVLGTSLEVRVLAISEAAANRAEAAVLAHIDRDAAILSGYDRSSEFSRWFQTRNTAETVSPELFDILQRFDRWRARTHGALDASVEAVSRVWMAAAAAGRVPTAAEMSGAVSRVQRRHWRLDAANRTATHLTDAPLVLNSFTKSYIVDRAASAGLNEDGVRAIVVNIGGDLVTRGAWTETVRVTDPQASADNAPPVARLSVRDRAVATSGGYRRGFDIGGVHYSHIVDPRTGRPTGHVLSATVVAPSAADAGALATAFCVLTPDESGQLARTVPGAEFLLLLADGRRIESAGWRDLTIAPPRPAALPQPVATLHAAGQGTWNTEFELTVSLTIALQPRRAHRPYVAVWVEDRNRARVRTLAVWYQNRHPKWLADLRAWNRGERQRGAAGGTDLGSVSGATRGPGKYSIVWDGKDSAGALVKAGPYTVLIEAAREDGTYQIMRQDMDLSGTARAIDLPGNIEVSAASLDYHRVVGK